MFEEGNFAELSITNTTLKVTDDKFSPNGSMLGQTTNTSMSVKMKINDRLSFGLQHFDAARIDLSYAGNGGPFTKSADPYKTQVAVTEDAVKKDGATQTAIGNYLNANGLSQIQANINIAIAKDAATQKAISDYYAGLSTSQIQGILLTKYTSAANIPLSKEPFVDLSFKSTVLALTYKVNDRVDIFGGIKYSVGSATGNVLIDPHGDLAASEASGKN